MTLCEPWATQNDLASCNCPSTDATTTDLALEASSEILYALTGRQYPGSCTASLRPCANGTRTIPFGWTFPWYPIRQGGQWLNLGGCGCHLAADCACTVYPRVNLGRADVQSITTVTIDGDVLDPDAYRLDSNRYLVRTDGEHWPCCQDLSLDAGDVGTWSIDLVYGWPVPASLVQAAAILATELVKACIDDNTCRLPSRTTSVVKQGITIEMSDPQLFFDGGRTGIYEVDLAITAANPNGLTQDSIVRSPEVRSAGVWG